MRTDLYLPPEVWHGHVLKHTVNNVYNLQRLRAVNKGFRETIDARVMAIVQTSDVTTVWMKTMLEHALYVVNQPRTCAKMRSEQIKRRRASALSVMGVDSPSMVIADLQTPRIQCKDVDGEGSVALRWN